MVKKLATRKAAARKIKSSSKSVGDDLDSYGVASMKMFDDPCGATLSETIYEGDMGYVNRFVSNFTLGVGATDTAAGLVIRPGVGVAATATAASSGSIMTFNYGDTVMPGAGYLNSVSTKFRCAGFCAIVTPIASPNNSTGTISVGNIPQSSIPQSSSFSADTVNLNLNEKLSSSQALIAPFQVKWQPGLFDDKYCGSVAVLSDDDTDRNALCIIMTGFPAGSGVNVRLVGIYEWTPIATTGIVIDSTAIKRSRCNLACVLRNLKRKSPTWWFELGRAAVGGYIQNGVMGAAAKSIKFL